MASCFNTYFLEDDICAIHEAVVKKQIPRKRQTLIWLVSVHW